MVARVWKPDAPGRWPVLLMRQPYGRAIASTPTYAHPRWYAAQGYAVVVQDVRGCGESGGTFGGFAQEEADSSWTLAWARTLPYADGRLGSYGFSYQGLTQLLGRGAAAQADCLAPAMAGLDERLHWASSGGAHRWGLGLGWGLQLAAEHCRRCGDGAGWWEIRRSLESGRFLHEGLELLARLDPGSMVLEWFRQDPLTAKGWRVHSPPAALLQRPMLLAGGWHDPYLEGVLDLWSRSRALGGTPWLRLGPWTHLDWGGGIDALQLAFFDRHLRDRPPPKEPRERLFDLGVGLWREREPAQARGGPWGLSSNGRAAIDPEEGCLISQTSGGGEVCFVHDPWRPRPGRGGHLGLDAGAVDRRELDQRSDGACFTSAPLEEPLELLGRPVLELELEADQPGFDLCAALSVLRGGGAAVEQLSTGVGRFLGPACLRRERRRLELQPLLLTLAAGDRLRLSLAAAAWPQIAVNPGTAELPRGWGGPTHRVITLVLRLDSAQLMIEAMGSGTLAPSNAAPL
ncbi:CocE/NonD family hydrolase [Cyanobium sp. Morenito 9A2]|nr:CocE/NonD family hydrolase [Cyanobium sp. Morenito 9A2]